MAAPLHQDPRHPRRQESASAELSGRRHGDAGRSRFAIRAQHGHHRIAATSWWPTAWTSSAACHLPDVLAIASFYKDWASIGAGIGNYMAYGDYPEDDSANPSLFLPTGIIHGRDLTKLAAVDQSQDHRAGRPFLVRLFRRRRRGAQSVQGRNQPALYRAEAALSVARGQSEIQLAEIAAL